MSICVVVVDAHKVEQGPRLMVVLTQTMLVWAVGFYLVGSQG